MTPAKRTFDIIFALLGIVLLALPLVLIAGVLLVSQGRPILYLSERMKSPEQSFLLWKFRTMRIASSDNGVSGGDKALRITDLGRVLRSTRLDEAPQLWNILRGDISFVGPRPPLKTYVERFPHLYGKVLTSRPGVTGLATLVFHTREERLLSACTTSVETDTIYVRRCIPRKAQLDLIYQENQTVWLDSVLLFRTIFCLFKKPKSDLPAVQHSRRSVALRSASKLI